MTLQSSGTISINDLVGEYGSTGSHRALTHYYRGGQSGLVLDHSNNANIPTSGTIDLADFYGMNNTAPVTDDEYASFNNAHNSFTIGKTTTNVRGWMQMILHFQGSAGSDGNSHFQYGSSPDVYLAGANAQTTGSANHSQLQMYDDGFRNGSTYDITIAHHTSVQGKTCEINGVNCGTIGTSWSATGVSNSSLGQVQQTALGNATALWNSLSNSSATNLQVRIY